MSATVDQSFLAGFGLAPSANVVSPSTIQRSDDDPTLWTSPARGGFADGFSALVDELFDVEQRIDQGEAVIAEKRASKIPVPATWTVRLQSLNTKRTGLRKDLTEKYPKALGEMANLVSRMNRQEDWFRNAGIPCRDGDPVSEQESIWNSTLAQYERLAEAIDRAFETVSEQTKDDPDSVSWARAWQELRALGFAERHEVEKAIGGWSSDPQEVVRRAKALSVPPRRIGPRTQTPNDPKEPPLMTIAQVKDLMNQIADRDGLPQQYDEAGRRIPRSSLGFGV